MDYDCWHFIRLCYCCCCCRIDHSQIWASFFFFFFLSRLSYRLADIDDVFLCTIMTDHGEEEKKGKEGKTFREEGRGRGREREKKKIWFAVLISYRENISTHSGCFFSFFSSFCGIGKGRKSDLFSLRFVLCLRHKRPPTLKIFPSPKYT